MPNKGNLLTRSMTQFPFVGKQMSVLASLCTNAVPGFLLFPKSPGGYPPGDSRLCCFGDTSGAPGPSRNAPDTVATVCPLKGEGIHATAADWPSDPLSCTLTYRLDNRTSVCIQSHTHADFSHLHAYDCRFSHLLLGTLIRTFAHPHSHAEVLPSRAPVWDREGVGKGRRR